MGVLSGEQIRKLSAPDQARPLVSGCVDLDRQLQPNGIDLTVREIERVIGQGRLTWDNEKRRLSATDVVPWGDPERALLGQGVYLATFNEVVDLPPTLTAIIEGRSSLMRCGVVFDGAIWDAGYHGRGKSLLMVLHPMGIVIERNARIAQLVFLTLDTAAQMGYQGGYQGEGL